ncbi:hypothetical protein CKO11_16335 [Rhodobacter sp. TJ_12]|uniref:Hint domain-containing protein n=1 Tax=Rhodobacter sp. TJ_12 TaxID=2029399 RepID=UPI001CBCF98D|nr:Hint domain-containing protein [Rhodobacter sp. TJ_12]MBZ4024019.1 hypothetical protein [Rhodobacter sp. TJ_12]
MDRQATGQGIGASAPTAGPIQYRLDSQIAPAPGLGRTGFALGARVATQEGLLPVEYLSLGDRVITRSGARVLRAITSLPLISNLVRIAPGALGHNRPGAALVLGAGTRVLLRDWRAQALFGAPQALVPVVRLLDGQFITRETGRKTRLFALHFDTAEVVYADGVEIGCTPLKVQTGA